MSRIAYNCDGLPQKWQPAYTPMPALTPAASSHGIIKIYGSPGTTKEASPPPHAIPNKGPDPRTQPSDVAPSWWRPDKYFTDVRSVFNEQDHTFSWMPPYTLVPPKAGEYQRVPSQAFNPYPGLPQGYAMTWPRTMGNQWRSYTEPGVRI